MERHNGQPEIRLRDCVALALADWRRALRRNAAALVAVLALLFVGVVEPVLCIVHCAFSAHTGHAAAHATHEHSGTTAVFCDHTATPEHGAPQPFHELIAVLLLALPALTLLVWHPAPPAPRSNHLDQRPPLPPPIQPTFATNAV